MEELERIPIAQGRCLPEGQEARGRHQKPRLGLVVPQHAEVYVEFGGLYQPGISYQQRLRVVQVGTWF